MKISRCTHGYLDAVSRIRDAGYEDDIIWADSLGNVKVNDHYLMREYAWVVVNSGFRAKVAQKLWPGLRLAFHEFVPQLIDEGCRDAGLRILNHSRKMQAIVDTAKIITRDGIEGILADAKDPQRLTRLPYIGKITCYHLAKLLGADVVKPDVHLTRAAHVAGFASALALCETIRDQTGERLTVIDSVLWRYGEQQVARGWPSWELLFTV